MSRVILCTGGIGSGKTYVTKVFVALGVAAYNCDSAAKQLYDRDPVLLSGVVSLCGKEVLDSSGKLDRRALAARIFSDPELLTRLETLVHPAVIRDFERWKSEQDSSLLLIEAAVPVPSGIYDSFLLVTAPADVRIGRALRRAGADEAEIRRRMALQPTDEELVAKADYILNNDGRQAVLPEIIRIFENEKDRS